MRQPLLIDTLLLFIDGVSNTYGLSLISHCYTLRRWIFSSINKALIRQRNQTGKKNDLFLAGSI